MIQKDDCHLRKIHETVFHSTPEPTKVKLKQEGAFSFKGNAKVIDKADFIEFFLQGHKLFIVN